MGGHGHRNMYYATGLPGWVRFGYSPGWGALPPAAQYLQSTGQMGTFLASLGYPAGTPGAWPMPGMAPLSSEQELEMLKRQKEELERQIETLTDRLEALEKEA
jgi:hypothetical protein